MKRILLLAGMFLVCTGCVEVATVPQTGTIGEDEIIARWGTPTDRHVFEDHSQTLTWSLEGSCEESTVPNAGVKKVSDTFF